MGANGIALVKRATVTHRIWVRFSGRIASPEVRHRMAMGRAHHIRCRIGSRSLTGAIGTVLTVTAIGCEEGRMGH